MNHGNFLTLGFGETSAAPQVLSHEPSITWFKPWPGVLLNQSGLPFDPACLNAGHRPSHARRLDCLRSVHLLWSNFFISDGCISTIYDGDARNAVQQVVAYEDLSRYIGVTRRNEDFVVPHTRLRDAQRIAGTVLFATSDEPHNWGLWLLYVLPAVVHFTQHRHLYRKLFVFAVHPNMRALLALLGVRDDDYEPLVIDWRAPAASPFYRATPVEPLGVLRRRVLRCKGADVVGVEDDLMVPELPDDLVAVGEPVGISEVHGP